MTGEERCPACGFTCPPGAKFCGDCGRPIEAAPTCVRCGTENPAGNKFCRECGQHLAGPDPSAYTPSHLAEKILRDRSRIEGERRVVSVLFADAVGSVELGEQLDAEEVYSVMQDCVARMLEAVHRFEGTVTQFRGDGIMALFGAPIAHEDAARRAVAAAMEMQRTLSEYVSGAGIDCAFRVGVNTGPVVVGRIGDDLVMDYTALGDTVNLAARLEGAAEAGTVYVSDGTFRAVGDFFECAAVGDLLLKGKAASVPAYRVVRETALRTRFEAAAARELTPFVGRDQEIGVLRGYLEETRRGEGRVVAVVGEAGIGKSRLVYELQRSTGPDTGWLVGRSISYGRTTAYLPVTDLVKACFGVLEEDADEAIAAKVAQVCDRWENGGGEAIPYLRFLLSVDPDDDEVASMDARERRAGILASLRTLVVEESRRRPLVVLVEDLHWIDEPSQDALLSIVDVIGDIPVLLVLTYRPGYTSALVEHISRVALGSLHAEEMETMAAGVLCTADLPAELVRLIASKAEGNPFYVEEVTKTLVETGALVRSNGSFAMARPVEEISVPDTIQEVILARIDRLDAEAKQAIQLASVIGREFTVRLLGRLSEGEARLDGALAELKSLELIYEKAFFPELAYMFKHALTHDVAYSTLLVERRKALHRVVAAAVEELYADRVAEHYETLAYHYLHGEVWDKAMEYLELAGGKAAGAFAVREAAEHYAKGFEVAERLGDGSRASAFAQLGGLAAMAIGDWAAARAGFDAVIAASRASGDRHAEGMGLAFRGIAEVWSHEPERGEASLREAIDVGGEFDDVRFAALSDLVFTWSAFGRLAEADAYRAEALELMEHVDDPAHRGWLSLIEAMRHNWAGRFEEGLAIVERWLPVARQQLDAYYLNRAGAIMTLGHMGRYEEALAMVREVRAKNEEIGHVRNIAGSWNLEGWILGELEDHVRALDTNRRCVEISHDAPEIVIPEVLCNGLINCGDNLVALGRLDEAEEYLAEVEQIVRSPGPADMWALWTYSQHHFHSYGELWLAREDLERALSYADECLALAERTDRPKNVVKARRLRAQVFSARGEEADAAHELETALGIARRIGNPPQLWKTLVAMGELRRRQGRDPDAHASFEEAMAVVERVAAGLTDEALRATFLGSRAVQGIGEALGRRSDTPVVTERR